MTLRTSATSPSASRSGRRAMTLVELLVAILIASIFLVGIVGALSALLQGARDAERRSEAVRQARSALDQISEDLASASTAITSLAFLSGVDVPLATGDLIDNDGDGPVDEEAWDGTNTDGGPVVQNHVPVSQTDPTLVERPRQALINELGDGGVDEDPVFQHDRLTFVVDGSGELVSYRIGRYEGEENVLLRVTGLRPVAVERTDPGSFDDLPFTPIAVRVAPLAYDVLSFSVLCFDPNWIALGSPNPWKTSWNSVSAVGFRFPPTIYLAVTVYSGDIPLGRLPPGSPLPSVTLRTQVVLEGALTAYWSQF